MVEIPLGSEMPRKVQVLEKPVKAEAIFITSLGSQFEKCKIIYILYMSRDDNKKYLSNNIVYVSVILYHFLI